jgi:hypothetical protein
MGLGDICVGDDRSSLWHPVHQSHASGEIGMENWQRWWEINRRELLVERRHFVRPLCGAHQCIMAGTLAVEQPSWGLAAPKICTTSGVSNNGACPRLFCPAFTTTPVPKPRHPINFAANRLAPRTAVRQGSQPRLCVVILFFPLVRHHHACWRTAVEQGMLLSTPRSLSLHRID